jgi:hypothetical protein
MDIWEKTAGGLLTALFIIIGGYVSMVKRWANERFQSLEDGHKELSTQLGHHNEVLTDHDKRMEVSKVYMQGVRDDITELKTTIKESDITINTKLDKIINGN